MCLSIPQIQHVWALSSYIVTKWKVIEGRKIPLGFAATSVILLGNGLSSEGVERWEIQCCQLLLHPLHHTHYSPPACRYSNIILVSSRYLYGRGCRRGQSLLPVWLYCESAVVLVCWKGEGAGAFGIRVRKWELLINVSSFDSFSSALKWVMVVWVLLVAFAANRGSLLSKDARSLGQ